MRNAQLFPRQRAARKVLATPMSLLLVLPLALTAFAALAQTVPAVAQDEQPGPAVSIDDTAGSDESSAQTPRDSAAAPTEAAADSPLVEASAAVEAAAEGVAEAVPPLAAPLPAPAAVAPSAEPVTESMPAADAEPVAAPVDAASEPASSGIEQPVPGDAPAAASTVADVAAPATIAAPTPIADEVAPMAASSSVLPAAAPAEASAAQAVQETRVAEAESPLAQTVAPAPAPAPTTPVPAPAPDPAPVAAAVAPTSTPAVPASVPVQVPMAAPVAPIAPTLVNDNNAIERQLGARCPNDLAARLATQGELLIGACQGTMPAHLAAVLVAIPEQQIHLPRAWRERQVAQRAWFKAVPGQGARPDFLVLQGDIWVRSFEGADPSSTVYLVAAPFECVDGRLREGEVTEPVRLAAGSCREGLVQERVYRVRAGAAPVDITAEVMPMRPPLGETEKKRYDARNGRVKLDHSKLQFGPAMRWYVQFEQATEGAEPRGYGDGARAHMAFLVWNGERFDTRESVLRNLWPCDPVAPGDRACGAFADAGRDPYVRADAAAVQSVGATP